MSQHIFYYSLAYIVAVPISAFVIGIGLDQAHSSRHVSLKFRWGNNAVAFLSSIFVVVMVGENCAWIAGGSGLLTKTLEHPTTSQMLIPACIGCTEFVVQVYYIQRFFNAFGRSMLFIFSGIGAVINVLVAWGCTLSILMKINNQDQELLDSTKFQLQTFHIETPLREVWLGTSSLVALLIVFGQVYSCVHHLDKRTSICFLRRDHFLIRIGVATLQTSALSALLIWATALLFLIDTVTGDRPSPGNVGSFVFLTLIRIPMSYGSLIFSLVRERKLSIDSIRMSLVAMPTSGAEAFMKDEKKNFFKNQVTVHTVRSQVFES